MAPSTASVSSPSVLRDPRFEAGRALIQQGLANEGAIEIFSTLVEECIAKHGESSIETSPAFFEYGNALLRASLAASNEDEEEDDDGGMDPNESGEEARNAAGEAAEARQKSQQEGDQKPAANVSDDTKEAENKQEEAVPNGEVNDTEEGDEGEDGEEGEGDDLQLSLEMMENAYSILDEYQTENTDPPYLAWTREQFPRILLGIGDCLAALQRHADAADAYSRALEWRQTQLAQITKSNVESLEHLQTQRRVCEATVLIAEELLACPEDEDVVATETQSLIVKAEERIEYARGYYDKARDSLQDTVFLMGKLASKSTDLGTEKEDVCFLATLIMGVGEALAAFDEQEAEKASEPAKKRAKTID
jgi:tetratricopeptide (TPR) repeat protein